ncbi:MAG: hypothetical protein IT393_01655 [Nitrospirae bacterium]|nr:hypothetical protein [Nitrospirota bacterium]
MLDEGLRDALLRHPELRSVLSKIDPEEQPYRYAAFLTSVIEKSLLQETDPLERLNLCNRLIDILAGTNENSHLGKHRLVFAEKSVLSEITPPHYAQQGLPRPATPIVESSLFTGSPHEPQLIQELQAEMRSADAVDILISFIK